MLLCYIYHWCASYGSLKKSYNTNLFKHVFGFSTLNVFCNVCITTLAITPKWIWSFPNWQKSWKLMKIKLYATLKLDEYSCNPNIRFVIKCGVQKHVRPWKSMFKNETHFHKWPRVQESEPNDSQSALPM